MVAQRRHMTQLLGAPARPAQPYTGSLPTRLGMGIEALSGLSMNHVKVHYESGKPAQLNALAYARGSDIHLGPGQERHLPHEAWHVVQQAQGRVGSTLQMAGVALNDNAGLEREADVMGARALSGSAVAAPRTSEARSSESSSAPTPVIQRLTAVAANVQSLHALVGNAQMSDEQPVDAAANGDRPVVIELMEGDAASATTKIDAIAASTNATDNRAVMIGLNARAVPGDVAANRLRAGRNFGAYNALVNSATAVAQHAEDNNVQGGCFPVIWTPTGGGGGYTFPFLEMRAHVTLHPGTAALIGRMRGAGVGDPILRSMDADVTADPILNNPVSGLGLPEQRLLGDLGRVEYEDRQVGGQDVVPDLSKRGADIVSGGYQWDTAAKPAAFWGGPGPNVATWNGKLTACLVLINDAEHDIRERYAAILPKSVYWPEPNTYMDYRTRLAGAAVARDAGQAAGDGAQQRESTYYIRNLDVVGHYDRTLQTTKPLKTYFNDLRDMIVLASAQAIPRQDVKALVQNVRQSHLSPGHLGHIIGWNGGGALSDEMTTSLETIRLNVLNRVVTAVTAALR